VLATAVGLPICAKQHFSLCKKFCNSFDCGSDDVLVDSNKKGSIQYPYVICRYALEADEVLALVHDSLSRVGMAGFEERPSHTLSGGQKQRQAHARTLSSDLGYLALPFSEA